MTRPRPHPLAFTLIEMLVVITITGVLAATAAPALRSFQSTREGGAAKETARLLAVARSTAAASGRPTGLAVSGNSLTLRNIPSTGALPASITGPLGETAPATDLSILFPGVAITSAVSGDSVSTNPTFWFSYDGTPQSRNSSGALLGTWKTDGTITLTGERTITVRKLSGIIE